MPTFLQIAGAGQVDMNGAADKINSNNDLAAMGSRVGAVAPIDFPGDFYGFQYLKFRNGPFTVDHNPQSLNVLFTCYGTPVITADVGWITGFDAHGVINGNGSDTLNIAKNVGAERVGTITITVTQPLGTYIIDTTVTQETPPSFTTIDLGYHLTVPNTACSNFVISPGSYDIESIYTFSTAPELFNVGGGSYATAGYYSDGSIYRYWTGASFTSSGACTI